MKYKVGDKVRIRGDLEINEIYGGYMWTTYMDYLRNAVVTIKAVYYKDYEIEELLCYSFTDKMIAYKIDEEIKVGDKVMLVSVEDEDTVCFNYLDNLNKIFTVKEIIDSSNKFVYLKETDEIKPYLKNLKKVQVAEIKGKENNFSPSDYIVTAYNTDNYFRINNNIKGEEIMEILKIYRNRKEEKINKEYLEIINKRKENDIFTQFLENANKQFKDMYKNEYDKEYNGNIVTTSMNEIYSKETEEQIDKLYINKEQEILELDEKVKEIESLLELAPNYEEKMKILRDYDIIEKKSNRMKEI